MKELSGLDAAFLYVETKSAHMHVVGTIILDTSEKPLRFSDLRTMLESRIHRIPAFRRRLLHVPMRIGHPVWVDDPDFRLSAHLHRIALPEPGSMRELEDFVGHLASIPLDRDRPLWDLWVVEGLEGGETALVCKFHHAAIDGVTGADLMQHLFDLSPNWKQSGDAESDWEPEPLPSDLRLLSDAAGELAMQPFRIARSVGNTIRSFGEMAVSYLDPESAVSNPALPLSAPDTKLNNAISADRNVSLGNVALADIKRIKNALGLTVNDVILAACSLALRDYLQRRRDLPDQPLVAVIPVSLHDETSSDANNAVSAMFVRLPVHLRDPLEHLDFIAHDAREAKALHRSSSSSLLSEWAEYASPTWFAGLMNLYSSFNVADAHSPLYNLVVSNVPGPPMPLYCVGHRVKHCHPLGPIFEGASVNMTVMSYVDKVGLGVMGCPEVTPKLDRLARAFEEAVERMLRAVEKPKRRIKKTARKPARSRRKPARETRRASA